MPHSPVRRKQLSTEPYHVTHPFQSISSTSNPAIKRLRGLDRKKGRKETGLFLAEGARLVQQGLTNGWHAETLLVAANALDRPANKALAQHVADQGGQVLVVPERLVSQVTRKDNAQTVVAAFGQRHAEIAPLPSPQGPVIALYEIRDPGNLGTILRTADCAGASGVILVETCCDPYSVEAVRASMGSVFDIPFVTATLPDLLSWRAEHGLPMTGASMHGDHRHTEARLHTPGILLMGNEQSGLPPSVEAACDTLVRIPMRGGADSLNLAQATAIMLYEAWRQMDFKGAHSQ